MDLIASVRIRHPGLALAVGQSLKDKGPCHFPLTILSVSMLAGAGAVEHVSGVSSRGKRACLVYEKLQLLAASIVALPLPGKWAIAPRYLMGASPAGYGQSLMRVLSPGLEKLAWGGILY